MLEVQASNAEVEPREHPVEVDRLQQPAQVYLAGEHRIQVDTTDDIVDGDPADTASTSMVLTARSMSTVRNDPVDIDRFRGADR